LVKGAPFGEKGFFAATNPTAKGRPCGTLSVATQFLQVGSWN
jgi:hypothetical protein